MSTRRLCACGCKERVSRQTENNHLSLNAPVGVIARLMEEDRLFLAAIAHITRRTGPAEHDKDDEEEDEEEEEDDSNQETLEEAMAVDAARNIPNVQDPHNTDVAHEDEDYLPMDIDNQQSDGQPDAASSAITSIVADVRVTRWGRRSNYNHQDVPQAGAAEDEDEGEEEDRLPLPGELSEDGRILNPPPDALVGEDEENSDDEFAGGANDPNFPEDGAAAAFYFRQAFEREAAAAANLDAFDLSTVKLFTFKIEGHLTEKLFNQLPQVYPEIQWHQSLKRTKKHIASLSGIRSIRYSCCINSCVCFTGSYEELDQCPECKEPRFKPNGRPRKYFEYIPLIPRLKAKYANPEVNKLMLHRSKHQHHPGVIKDVYDGTHYQSLLNKTVPGSNPPSLFFADQRDVALGLSTDGFAPFKKRDKTCWPIILFNYNLSPKIRFKKKYCMNVGTIPGPKKPKDCDSFLWPLFNELLQLEMGVEAYDGLQKELFILCAFLILVFGDIPAVALLMRMKGHNGFRPCRMCNIPGIRVERTLYVPLSRTNLYTRGQDLSDVGPLEYQPGSLPMRSHEQFMEQASEVQLCPTITAEDELAQEYGIKGVPLLSWLSSLSFPYSFPYDFMHLIWENTVKNLILFWTGKFKDLSHENKGYRISPAVWEQIGAATEACGSYIPTSFGARVPNIAKDGVILTAEMYCNWTMFIAPVVLKGRFPQPKYYHHFLSLARLISLCLEMKITAERLDEIEQGFRKWVADYELYYYEKHPSRLSACPLTIHALLHIADGIRACGPVWAYWAFPMERHCNTLLPAIESRRHPYAAIAVWVTATAQLDQIRLKFINAEEAMELSPPKPQNGVVPMGYEKYRLSSPCRYEVLDPPTCRRIWKHLRVRYGGSEEAIKAAFRLDQEVQQFGRITIIDGEEVIRGDDFCTRVEDTRDASFIRYDCDEDQNMRFVNMPVVMVTKSFYGQLKRVIVLSLPAAPHLGLEEPTQICVALVQRAPTTERNGIHYYRNTTIEEIVDLSTVKCPIGRIQINGGREWAIVDRTDLAVYRA